MKRLKETRLTCSTPNAGRKHGGSSSYYCVPSSNKNIPCHIVDTQVEAWIQHIHIEPSYIPLLKQAYREHIELRVNLRRQNDQMALQEELEKLAKYEKVIYMDCLKGRITEELYTELWRDFNDQYQKTRAALEHLGREKEYFFKGLDDAVRLLAKIGILYNRLESKQKRQLLLHLIERVVVNREGLIVKMDLRPPFGYLTSFRPAGESDGQAMLTDNASVETKTSKIVPAGCSSELHSSTPSATRTRASASGGQRSIH